MKECVTGNELVEWMHEYDKVVADPTMTNINQAAAGVYSGFVMGVVDATEVLKVTVTRGEIFAIVAMYLKGHPNRWNKLAVDLVMNALTEAFPKKSKWGL